MRAGNLVRTVPVTHREVRDCQRSISAAFVALAFDLSDGVVVVGDAVRPRKSRVGNSLGFLAKSTANPRTPGHLKA
jgi:hypothetical protein